MGTHPVSLRAGYRRPSSSQSKEHRPEKLNSDQEWETDGEKYTVMFRGRQPEFPRSSRLGCGAGPAPSPDDDLLRTY